MKKEYTTAALFLLITAIIFYLFYQVIIPFVVPISWAAVLAVIFFPLYERLRKRLRMSGVASLIMCIIILLLIVGPVTYVFIALVNEAADAVSEVNRMYKSGQLDNILAFDMPWVGTFREKLAPYYDISQIKIDEIVKDTIDRVSGVILNQTSWLLTNGTRTIFYFVLMIFSLYYFFKDGEKLIRRSKRLIPLPPERINETFRSLRDVIQATIYGGGVVALIQGVLGGVMFAIFGIPSPVFWGAIMAFLSIIPFVGAFVVYIPAGILLMLGGSYIKGLLVIVIGVVVVSQIDNLVRPYLISGRTQMHPLLLFFSIMGGIAMLGLLGLVVGPMIAAIFDTILRVLEFRMHTDGAEVATIEE